MVGPGVPSGEVRETPVVLADVASTIAGTPGLGFDPRVLAIDQLSAEATGAGDAADDEPARTAGVQRRLDARLAEFERQKASLAQQESRAQFELSPELARMLDQLGYLQGDDEAAGDERDARRKAVEGDE